MEENILKDYTERANYAAQQAIKHKKLADNYSLYRLAVFGLFIMSVALAISLDEITIIVLALVALIICFAGW